MKIAIPIALLLGYLFIPNEGVALMFMLIGAVVVGVGILLRGRRGWKI